MPYTKKMVCFANSRKYGYSCIAGKEIDGSGVKGWIRPVSQLEKGELTDNDICYCSGTKPKVLDIISITFEKPAPSGCQTENHLISKNSRWVKVTSVNQSTLYLFLDSVETLWMNGFMTRMGYNDRIPVEMTCSYNYSLVLIEPDDVTFCVSYEEMRKRVRALFKYNGTPYKLIITDPEFELRFTHEGEYYFSKKLYFCISLSVPFIDNYCYKLIAGIIEMS